MKHVHSIIIVKKDNKYLNIYDDRWDMLLFPNIKGNNIEDIIKYLEDNFKVHVKEDNIKFLFDKVHEKYSVSNKENRTYHHYFYEVNVSNVEGNYYTLDELLSIEKVKENNSDVIGYIENYYINKL